MICVYRKCMREVALPHLGYIVYRFHDTQGSPPMLNHHKHDACMLVPETWMSIDFSACMYR